MTLRKEKVLDDVTGQMLSMGQIQRRRRFQEEWEGRYQELVQFYMENGHSNVQRSDPNKSLASWVHSQRNRHQRDELLPYQRKLLEDVDFVFVLGKGFHHVGCDKKFIYRMQQLREYKMKTGHIRIPKKYPPNQSLAWWYHQLRCRRRKALLSLEEIEILDDMGFEWETAKTKLADQIRAEDGFRTRRAAEVAEREQERIRTREEHLQIQEAAKKKATTTTTTTTVKGKKKPPTRSVAAKTKKGLVGAVLPLKKNSPVKAKAAATTKKGVVGAVLPLTKSAKAKAAPTKKNGMVGAVLPPKKKAPAKAKGKGKASTTKPTTTMLTRASRRRDTSSSTSDTETEYEEDDDDDDDDDEDEEDKKVAASRGCKEEDDDDEEEVEDDDDKKVAAASRRGTATKGGAVTRAQAVVACSRVDYDSDSDSSKVVVASIVWDSPPSDVEAEAV